MSLTHSPNTVTSGLVFNYDMNSIRSFKGAPTTNLVPSAATMSGFVNYGSGPVSTFVTEFGTTGWRMNSAGSWNGTLRGITIPTTGTYTFSAWYRYWGGSDNNNGATCYVSGWGGGDSAATIDKSKIGQWQRISITLNVTTASCTLYLISYGGTNGADNSTWDVTMPQVEAGSFATPWVDGSRSNTQAITDLTGNNTITANSLTYASNGTFSFNGSSNTLNCGNASAIASITGTNNVTVESWVNLSGYGSTSGYGVITHKGFPWAFLMENPGNTMRIRFSLSNSGDVSCPDSTTHALNTWYHFVGSYDGTNMRFYRNGVLTNTVAGSGTLGGAGSSMVIGSYSGAYFSQGQISVVKIYNRTLSATEVQQNFNSLRSRYGI